MINLNNFVTVNIDYDPVTYSSGSRPTVVLLDDSTISMEQKPSSDEYYWSSLSEYIDSLGLGTGIVPTHTQLYKMVATFFNNGGKEIHYIRYNESSGTATSVEKIKALSSNEIVVTGCFSDKPKLFNIATVINADEDMSGVNEKFFLISEKAADITEDETKFDAYPNIAIKVGDPGIEMTIAAYLSKIDIDKGIIQDYCFTSEYIGSSTDSLFETSILDDNDKFKKLKNWLRYNVNINLAQGSSNDTRNYGGNTAAKQDLVNYYVKIILTQTLSQALLTLLKTKLKYSQSSISLISATIIDELNRYKKAGYISTDKTWIKGDRYDKSGNYLLLSNNTQFTRGYVLSILPLASLSSADIAQHKLPDIYLFIADTYSIREISLTGKLF